MATRRRARRLQGNSYKDRDMAASASTSTTLPTEAEVAQALHTARCRHQSVLAAWTLDLMALRRSGVLRPQWDRDADATAWWRRAA
jgi:hypothetical protein